MGFDIHSAARQVFFLSPRGRAFALYIRSQKKMRILMSHKAPIRELCFGSLYPLCVILLSKNFTMIACFVMPCSHQLLPPLFPLVRYLRSRQRSDRKNELCSDEPFSNKYTLSVSGNRLLAVFHQLFFISFCCPEQAAGWAKQGRINNPGSIIFFVENETKVQLHTKPRGKLLIPLQGGEMATRESLKNGGLGHSDSSRNTMPSRCDGGINNAINLYPARRHLKFVSQSVLLHKLAS